MDKDQAQAIQNPTMRRKVARVLRVLMAGGHIRKIPSIEDGTESAGIVYGLFKNDNRLSLPTLKLEQALVRYLMSVGLATQRGSVIGITKEGIAWSKRDKAGRIATNMREERLDVKPVDASGLLGTQETSSPMTVNTAESPLIWLYTRKDKAGRTLISQSQYKAGLRLHGDYRQAGVETLSSARWDSPMSVSGRKGGGGLPSNPSGNRLDALQRFRCAIDDVGPELADILVDICCLERGLGDVEANNRWLRRSAKVVLDLGLTRLARHYGLEGGLPAGSRRIRHWGDAQYRPIIDGDECASH